MAQITDTSQIYCPKCGKTYNVHHSEIYELPPGTFLNDGRYLVGKSIGTGGFGITYIGRDMKLDKRVVIKETFYSGIFHRNCTDKSVENPLAVTYDGETVSLEEIVYKTQKECLSLSKGEKYSNIVKVYDYIFENHTAYIITEYINGKTLHDRICAIGRFSWYDLYPKMKPLMQCLATLHREGLLHRDIKPQNIMIRRVHEFTEEFVLIDFGLARTTQNVIVDAAFTPGFSPPEQKKGEELDGTYTDVYSLGATIYNALTGEIPPEATSQNVHENFPLLNSLRGSNSVPNKVVSALEYALDPNYTTRCKTIDGFMYMLENDSSTMPVITFPTAFETIDNQGVRIQPPLGSNSNQNVFNTQRNAMYANMPSTQFASAPMMNDIRNAGQRPDSTGYQNGYNQNNYPQTQYAQKRYTPGNLNIPNYANVYINPSNMQVNSNKEEEYFPLPIITKSQSIAINFLYIIGIKMNGEIITSGGIRVYPFAQISKEMLDYGKQMDEIKKELKTDSNTLKQWDNVTSVATGNHHELSRHIVGLISDGTVVAVGENSYGECNVGNWNNVVAIYTGEHYTVGLRVDGTVIATGNNCFGQCNVNSWHDIVAVCVGSGHTVGLFSNGKVIATGSNSYGQCNVEMWDNIIAVSASRKHTVGLKADGTVVATGDNTYGQCEVTDWRDVSVVCVSSVHTVGLLSSGRVKAAGHNSDGQCNVTSWRNISSISISTDHTVGLRTDGTVVATGNNDYGQCNVEEWDNIMEIYTYYRCTVGLKWNGTVVATGYNDFGQCSNIKNWKNIRLPRTATL